MAIALVLLRVLVAAICSLVVVSVRRLLRGPLYPGWSFRFELIARLMQWGTLRAARAPAPRIRAFMRPARLAAPIAAKVQVQAGTLGPCPIETITPVGWTPGGPVVLYMHGGGYAICSPGTHRDLIARIALAARAQCIGVDYRLAPEHPFPAAVDDCVAVYQALLDAGIPPSRIILSGDSAGGGACVSALLTLRDQNLPLPAGAMLISPWLDHAMTGASIHDNAPYDYIQREVLEIFSAHYLRGAEPRHPLASPLYADLAQLPPILLHAGGAEAIRSEIEAFADRARAQGVDVTLFVGEGMIHAWHAFAPILPECRPALRALGDFARHLTSSP